jgi:hypothetical protein
MNEINLFPRSQALAWERIQGRSASRDAKRCTPDAQSVGRKSRHLVIVGRRKT